MPLQRSKPEPRQNQIASDATEFGIGERIKMSPLGAARCPRLAHKIGTAIGFTYYKRSVAVIFDGNKTSTSIHIDYIEPMDRGARDDGLPPTKRRPQSRTFAKRFGCEVG
jgi:hypothetical protein